MILVLLAIDHPQKEMYFPLLVNAIEYQQLHSGELQTFFFEPRETGVDYYPGESLLRL